MTTIEIGRVRHLTSTEVETMVNARCGVEEITDECAATIASWWQSPDRNGIAFAALSTSGTVDYARLCDNIADARRFAQSNRADPEVAFNLRALDMLSTWALAKTRSDSPRPASAEATLCRCGCGYPTRQRNGYVRLHTPKR